MDFAIRKPAADARRTTKAHRCPQCRAEALVLQRRHVSPASLGPSLVTEYYDCDFCDAHFKYSPADDRWKPLSE